MSATLNEITTTEDIKALLNDKGMTIDSHPEVFADISTIEQLNQQIMMDGSVSKTIANALGSVLGATTINWALAPAHWLYTMAASTIGAAAGNRAANFTHDKIYEKNVIVDFSALDGKISQCIDPASIATIVKDCLVETQRIAASCRSVELEAAVLGALSGSVITGAYGYTRTSSSLAQTAFQGGTYFSFRIFKDPAEILEAEMRAPSNESSRTASAIIDDSAHEFKGLRQRHRN